MKERPILFSGEMVRAILDGRKTQTRRLLSKKNLQAVHVFYDETDPEQKDLEDNSIIEYLSEAHSGAGFYVWDREYPEEGCIKIECPYGKPGDRLWVRERMRRIGAVVRSSDGRPLTIDVMYEADRTYGMSITFPDRLKGIPKHGQCLSYGGYREASRIDLEITGVRVERLRDISRQDAKAEGFWPSPLNGLESLGGRLFGNAQLAFEACWKDINGEGSWNANPWVWVIEFKRVSK